MKKLFRSPQALMVGLLGAAGVVGLLGCASPTAAARLVDVSIVNRSTGERLTPYRHNGKLYVAGTPGDRYSIELKSQRGERVMTVMSVDGVNVLTGQTASASQSGYVIEGWQHYAISGWRKNMNEIAQFVFTALPDSYAARTGRPGNVGVIGVAVYRERQVPPVASLGSPSPAVPYETTGTTGTTGTAASSGARGKEMASVAAAERRMPSRDPGEMFAHVEQQRKAERLGTGHGEREYSPTRYTEFVRNSESPDEVITIYYDSRANLLARGIIPPTRYAEPKPFPDGVGFVPDPRS